MLWDAIVLHPKKHATYLQHSVGADRQYTAVSPQIIRIPLSKRHTFSLSVRALMQEEGQTEGSELDAGRGSITSPSTITMNISTSGLTDRGIVRQINEDMLLVNDERQIYAVADGLGGLPEGALASNLAISHLEEAISDNHHVAQLDYESLFNYLNHIVYEEGRKVSQEIGIGSTLTVLHLNGDTATIGHVGDCVVYLFRDGQSEKLTTDHTMAAEMRSRLGPNEAVYIPEYFSHTLTRCLGQQGTIEVDVYDCKLLNGDRILICSDGVTKTQSEEELLEEASKAETPEACTRQIIDLSNERGGPDNSTAIAIFVD